MDIIHTLAEELALNEEQTAKAVALLDEGNTVPFIARYRKEVTGSMDDETLRKLEDRLGYLRRFDERRQEIVLSIEKQEKMTPELLASLEAAKTMVELEDLYLPYRPKK
ncbi:MAG: RNA-binding transcriptional accessory protein, partial [Clostridia bacterium]|nr:RNA-binding transcriptional accessory protein [Clostridia bacterium]